MAFRVYKPKNFIKVRAEQVTPETIEDLADRLMGRIVKEDGKVVGLAVPTFDGALEFPLGDWILKNDENQLDGMSNTKFLETYEVARNTNLTALNS